jgi:hypothetical protein
MVTHDEALVEAMADRALPLGPGGEPEVDPSMITKDREALGHKISRDHDDDRAGRA